MEPAFSLFPTERLLVADSLVVQNDHHINLHKNVVIETANSPTVKLLPGWEALNLDIPSTPMHDTRTQVHSRTGTCHIISGVREVKAIVKNGIPAPLTSLES
jgi:hypothetical protein